MMRGQILPVGLKQTLSSRFSLVVWLNATL